MKNLSKIFKIIVLSLFLVSILPQSALAEEGLGTPVGENLFLDIDDDHENIYAIKYLKNSGVVGGYEDGNFKPDNKINRAELIKIVVFGQRIIPNEDYYSHCFPDVGDDWYAASVCYAEAQGWIRGYDDGNFYPDKYVNRVEALKIIQEAYGIPYELGKVHGTLPDVVEGQWFEDYLVMAQELGIMPGTDYNMMNLGDELTRAETSEYLYRTILLEPHKDKYSPETWKIPNTDVDIEHVQDFMGIIDGVEYQYEELKDGGTEVVTESVSEGCEIYETQNLCYTVQRDNGGLAEYEVIGDVIFLRAEFSEVLGEEMVEVIYTEPTKHYENHNTLQYVRSDTIIETPIEDYSMVLFDIVQYTEWLDYELVDTPIGSKYASKFRTYHELRGELIILDQVYDFVYVLDSISYVVDGLGSVKEEGTLAVTISFPGDSETYEIDISREMTEASPGEAE